MIYKTGQEYIDKVRSDLDLVDEPIITDDQIIGFLNSAINIAEADIMKLNEDYFLTSDKLFMVPNVSEYDMPDNIYAAKLRGVIFSYAGSIYEVKPLKQINKKTKFIQIADILENGQSYDYQYDIENNSAEGFRFMLYPAAREEGEYIKRWYIRNASRIVNATDVVDIPEAEDYIVNYAKYEASRIANPDRSADLKDAMDGARMLMIATLEDMTPDEHNEIPVDVTFYQEHN